PGIQPSTGATACGTIGPGDKHRDDNGSRAGGGSLIANRSSCILDDRRDDVERLQHPLLAALDKRKAKGDAARPCTPWAEPPASPSARIALSGPLPPAMAFRMSMVAVRDTPSSMESVDSAA